jgi:hypothetical protein
MNEKILIPESVHEGVDLYDGFILSMAEGEFDFALFDADTIKKVYERLVHYADVMKYENRPNQDPEKYNEARGLSEKLGGYVSGERFRMMEEECEVWLG